MHISTKTEYAVRGLAELALHKKSEPISISEICNRQKLPRKYMEQLFRKLKKAELISSVHGAKGGYLLNKDVNQISLSDIMLAVDDGLTQVACEDEFHSREYCIGKPCGFYKLWNEIEDHLRDYFSSIRLDQIINNL